MSAFMEHIMLDLETMGNGPDAAIVAIGAVAFDLTTGKLGDEFLAQVSLESAVANGGVMDPSTVLWWLRQSDAARAAFTTPSIALPMALDLFTFWIQDKAPQDKVKVWGNGSEFDNVILAGAYRRAQKPLPWQFWNNRCYRTIKGLHPTRKLTRTGIHHNALDDARSQALHLCELMRSPAPAEPFAAPSGHILVSDAEWSAMNGCIATLRVDAELLPSKALDHLDAIRAAKAGAT